MLTLMEFNPPNKFYLSVDIVWALGAETSRLCSALRALGVAPCHGSCTFAMQLDATNSTYLF